MELNRVQHTSHGTATDIEAEIHESLPYPRSRRWHIWIAASVLLFIFALAMLCVLYIGGGPPSMTAIQSPSPQQQQISKEALLHKITVNSYEISVYGSPELPQHQVTLITTTTAADVTDIHITVDLKTLSAPPSLKLFWNHPQVETHYRWHPDSHLDRNIAEGTTRMQLSSSIAFNAPFYALFSADGNNRLSFVLSDVISPVFMAAVEVEENANVECRVDLGLALADHLLAGELSYNTTLRLDTRPIPIPKVAADASVWWSQSSPPAAFLEAAAKPLYSTWYAFHQRLDQDALLAELSLARELKMETIIIDDGWQTNDTTRGYAYCGDWDVAPTKFHNLKDFVKQAHSLGFKVLLWVAVPFVGEYSQVYKELQGCFLNENLTRLTDMTHDFQDNTGGWNLMDPRYPFVRSHITATLMHLLTTYDLDGFKLDFIDAFYTPNVFNAPSHRPKPSTFEKPKVSDLKCPKETLKGPLTSAIHQLLLGVHSALRHVKSDVLLEFRQKYIGPAMQQVGTMLRASDVPGNVDGNRIRVLDLRLLSGTTAVHSDPFLWNTNDIPESVAMHFCHTFFAVPQVSMQLRQLPSTHLSVTRFFLGLWTTYRSLLLNGTLIPVGLPALYTACLSHQPGVALAAVWYQPVAVIPPLPLPPRILLVNGSWRPAVLITIPHTGRQISKQRYKVTIYNCTGNVVDTRTLDIGHGVTPIQVPVGGVLEGTAV